MGIGVDQQAIIKREVGSDADSSSATGSAHGKLKDVKTAVAALGGVAGIADAVWDETTVGHAGAGSTGKALTDVLEDTAVIGAPAGASVSVDIAAVKVDTVAVLVDTADMQPKLGVPAGASMSADIADVKVDTAALLVDTGDGIDIETAAGAAGSLHSKLRAVLADTADVQPKIGAPAGASVSADIAAVKAEVDKIGAAADVAAEPGAAGSLHAHLREAQINLDAIETDTADIQTKVGAPAGVSLSADVAAVQADTDDMQTKIGTPEAALVSLAGQIGLGTNVEGTAGVAAETLHAKLRAVLIDTADMQPKLGAPAGASMSADIAAVKADTAAVLIDTADMQPKLGAPAGASMSADIADVKVDTAALLVDTADMQPKLGAPSSGTIAGDLQLVGRGIALALGTLDGVFVHTDTIFESSELPADIDYLGAGTRAIVIDASGGQNATSVRAVTSYDPATKRITLTVALPFVPVNGDTFAIIPA